MLVAAFDSQVAYVITWRECASCAEKARQEKIGKEVMFRTRHSWSECFMCWLDKHPTPVRVFTRKIRVRITA